MNDDLLEKFGARSTKQLAPSETIPVMVKGYILPPQGVPETPENTRLLGIRWDTGERIEVALRQLDTGDRPKLAQFQDDSGSSTPVTTQIGGTVMVERAYRDVSLKPLNTQMPVAVYNGRWLNRVSPTQDQGWALRCQARVNEPRLIDASNPASGKMQTITLLREEETTQISSLEQLDKIVLDALDTDLRNQREDWYKRPGAVNAIIRLSNSSESNIIELSGGFHTPTGAEFSEPKPRHMVHDDLAASQFWKTKRDLLAKAIESPQYTVEVIPCSTIFVGRKTLQKSLQTEKSPIKGISRADEEGREIKLFTDTVIGLRRSPKSGQPQALFVSPASNNQIASLTGRPSAHETALFNKHIDHSAKQNNREASIPIAQPTNTPTDQSNNQPPKNQSKTLPIRVTQGAANPNYIVAYASNDEQDKTIRTVASQTNSQYSPTHKAVRLLAENLPILIKTAKLDNHLINIEVEKQTNNQQAAIAPKVEYQEPVKNISNSPFPTQAAPLQTPPFSEPTQNADQLDLSQLDLSQIDLDSLLDDAYEESSFHQSRTR